MTILSFVAVLALVFWAGIAIFSRDPKWIIRRRLWVSGQIWLGRQHDEGQAEPPTIFDRNR